MVDSSTVFFAFSVIAGTRGWGEGTIDSAVGGTDTTIMFRPAPGQLSPADTVLRDAPEAHANPNYVRIGDEIVVVGQFSDLDKDVWRLENVTRGFGSTDPLTHATGAEAAGLYFTYNRNFVPIYDLDLENSLLDELAREYADFVNELHLDHLHFDGPEIHRVHPALERAYEDRVYSYVEHPTTSSSVGDLIGANLEVKFSALTAAKQMGYWGINVGLRLYDPTKFGRNLVRF